MQTVNELVRKLVCLFILSPLICMSQENSSAKGKYSFGLKTGLNISGLSVYNVLEERVKGGFNLGAFYRYPVTGLFSVQPEINFNTRGSKLTFDNDDFYGTARIGLRYLDIPVYGVFHPSSYFNFSVGPYFGVLAGVKAKNRNIPKDSDPPFNFEQEISKNNFKRTDTGLSVGMAAEFGRFTGGIRFNSGFTKIGKEGAIFGKSYTFPGARNRFAQFYIGAFF